MIQPEETDLIEEEPKEEESKEKDKTNFKKLRPLDEPPFDPKPFYICALIGGPILFLYICITCYCKCKRNARKELAA